MSDYPAPSPPYAGPPAHYSAGNNKPIRRIVIHSAVCPCEPGRAKQVAAYFRSESSGGSAHYITDPTTTLQSAWDSVICWHAPPNSNSIGIEMCDTPGPVPNDKPGTAAYKALKRAWRWIKPNQREMLRRTARLTARLCLAYDIPAVFLSVADLQANKEGITTHANVSLAFHKSTHWDPGFWPKRRFMKLVRQYIEKIKNGDEPAAEPDPTPAPEEPVKHKNPKRRRRFRHGTLNCLGFSHTAPGGNKPGWLGGVRRTFLMTKVLVARRLSNTCLQEFQSEQQKAFRVALPLWGMHAVGDNAVVWIRAKWKRLEKGTLAMPYFDGVMKAMPWVVLRTRWWKRRKVAILSFHNPANVKGEASQWRREGWRITAKWAKAMAARPDIDGVITSGDTNAIEKYFKPAIEDLGGVVAGVPSIWGIDWIVTWPNEDGEGLKTIVFRTVDSKRLDQATDHPLSLAVFQF